MKKNGFVVLVFSTIILITACGEVTAQQDGFVKSNGHQFTLNGEPLYYIGTNYWYGGLLGLNRDKKKGIDRLRAELDFLKDNLVCNLRLMAGPEGSGLVSGVDRVGPPLQPRKGIFDNDFLNGLDLLLSEMGKRNMKAVIFLSNNWEWSGGFLQYLQWNGQMEDSVFRRKLNWDETRDYVSKFYSCDSCKADYLTQVNYVLEHVNIITKKKYKDDPAIMSWEIANEPRPMRPSAVANYKAWLSDVSNFIKSKDNNHLVTIGTEGYIGTENIEIYEAIHSDKNIDYLTIHIWPKNWEWFKEKAIAAGMDSVLAKTKDYISIHEQIANKINKPLVVEEFGLPRDGHSFELNSTTTYRDQYYQSIFSLLEKNKINHGPVGGVNFWSYGGIVKPLHERWQPGDEYIGDPPMEEQGLNAVFNGDETTWAIIKASAGRLRAKN
ncbi:MAG: hypothetical protein ABIT58_10860 [Ferruginibacter sp.]